MAQWLRVSLMFCEGAHDTAFLNRLLKTGLEFEKAELKLSDLPYPISNVLQQSFKKKSADDLRLDMAKKFFLPDYLLIRDTTLVMVFNYGGSNRHASMSPFLENMFTLLEEPAFSGVGQPVFNYSVFADADHIGLIRTRDKVSTDLAKIGESVWLNGSWIKHENTIAFTQNSVFGPVATYIWKKWTEDNGTLEDIVMECLLGEAGLQQTLEFLDARFSWSPGANATLTEIYSSASKRLKAAFCVEGQRKKPGGSLGVVLDQADLLTYEKMERSKAVQDCLTFLRFWLGFTPSTLEARTSSS